MIFYWSQLSLKVLSRTYATRMLRPEDMDVGCTRTRQDSSANTRCVYIAVYLCLPGGETPQISTAYIYDKLICPFGIKLPPFLPLTLPWGLLLFKLRSDAQRMREFVPEARTTSVEVVSYPVPPIWLSDVLMLQTSILLRWKKLRM